MSLAVRAIATVERPSQAPTSNTTRFLASSARASASVSVSQPSGRASVFWLIVILRFVSVMDDMVVRVLIALVLADHKHLETMRFLKMF
jgi:hypothetical protein